MAYNPQNPNGQTTASFSSPVVLASNQLPGVSLTTGTAWSASSGTASQTIFTGIAPPAVLLQLDQTSTITAGVMTINVTYDGINWVTAPASSILDPNSTSPPFAQLGSTYTLTASTKQAFVIDSNGWQGLQIGITATIAGTGTVTPYWALLSYDPVDQAIVYSPTASNFNVTANTPTTASVYNGQTTASTSAGPLYSSSQALTQGVTIEALSTNAFSVYVGKSGVTTSTGIELPAGSAVTLPVNNLNVPYITSSTTSQVVTYIGI